MESPYDGSHRTTRVTKNVNNDVYHTTLSLSYSKKLKYYQLLDIPLVTFESIWINIQSRNLFYMDDISFNLHAMRPN